MRALLLLLIRALTFTGVTTANQSGSGVSAVKPPPLAELARLAEQGKLDGVTIEYWVGGGLPPPFYRSDQFRLVTVARGDILEFTRPYHDPDRTKSSESNERFYLVAQPSDVRKLAQLIVDTRAFERRFQEEEDPGRADALTTELIVTVGDHQYKRRYFTGSPKPLEPLRVEVERQIQRLVASGEHELFPKGESIPLSKLAEEVAGRIGRRLSAARKLTVWLNVSDANPAAWTIAKAIQSALKGKRGLVFAEQIVAGTEPVPSGEPGGHVNMLIYKVKPHPDLVLGIGEMGGRLCVTERDAGEDPLAPASAVNWILYVQ